MKEIITLQQAPIIGYDRMQLASEQIAKRIASLDLENQVVTSETVAAVKKLRAELNKEFKEIEAVRVFIKKKVTEPYSEFEVKYKELIKAQYESADTTLGDKVTAFEGQLKEAKADELKAYFDELCAAKGIDFLSFEGLRLNITLSEPVSKLKTTIKGAVDSVANDLELINSVPESDEYKSEVLAEYKRTLSTAGAFKAVNERRDARAAELKRLEAQKEAAQAQAAEIARAQAAQVQTQAPILQAPTMATNAPVAPVQAQPQAPILQAPTMATSAPIAPVQGQTETSQLIECAFKVRATMEQLRALKQFLITNNIEIL